MLSAFLFHEDGTLYYLSSYYILIQNLATLLCEMRDVNKGLQFEVDDLKQKLNDANGDIKVFKCMKFLSRNSKSKATNTGLPFQYYSVRVPVKDNKT